MDNLKDFLIFPIQSNRHKQLNKFITIWEKVFDITNKNIVEFITIIFYRKSFKLRQQIVEVLF
jgi:hypothetical protein